MADTKTIVTPIGEARYFCVGREETYQGKGTGKQTAQLVLKGEALKQLTKTIDEFVSDYYTPREISAGVTLPFKETKDGDVFIKAKAYLTYRDGKPCVIPVADASGKVLSEVPEIGNGSKVRLRLVLKKTEFQGKRFVGLTLKAIQIVTLVEGGEAGFDSAEYEGSDAYVADEFSGSSKANSGGFDPDELEDDIPF